MATIRLMHAKLHRVTVSSANVDYVGSIGIDCELMDRVGILPLEEVDVINLRNGKRWSTYVIPSAAGSGEICPNGGAALLCKPGDLLIIIAYETKEREIVLQQGHQAKVLIADEENRCHKLMFQELTSQGNKIELTDSRADFSNSIH